MKSLSDYNIGDKVLIVGISELELIIQCYENTDIFEVYHELDLESIAGTYVTIVGLPNLSDATLKDWDGSIQLQTDEGQILNLPMAAIADSDVETFSPREQSRIVRHIASEHHMIRYMAAETIQGFFRYHLLK